jgi:single-strand DNA-binding protein
VGIDGRLEWREWETPDHQKRQTVSVVADTVQFLGSRDAADNGADADGDAGADGELAPVGAAEAADDDEDIAF